LGERDIVRPHEASTWTDRMPEVAWSWDIATLRERTVALGALAPDTCPDPQTGDSGATAHESGRCDGARDFGDAWRAACAEMVGNATAAVGSEGGGHPPATYALTHVHQAPLFPWHRGWLPLSMLSSASHVVYNAWGSPSSCAVHQWSADSVQPPSLPDQPELEIHEEAVPLPAGAGTSALPSFVSCKQCIACGLPRAGGTDLHASQWS